MAEGTSSLAEASSGWAEAFSGSGEGTCHTRFLEGKPNANHVRARISYSRTQQLHNMDIITQCSK
jgi:hypothetical protein